MGENSHANNVFLLLAVLGGLLREGGFSCSTEEALKETAKVYRT